MVEHVLIRIADLREEAAAEEWQRLHPRSAALRRRLHYLRCRAKLACIRLRETALAQRARAAGARQHARLGEGATDRTPQLQVRSERVDDHQHLPRQRCRKKITIVEEWRKNNKMCI